MKPVVMKQTTLMKEITEKKTANSRHPGYLEFYIQIGPRGLPRAPLGSPGGLPGDPWGLPGASRDVSGRFLGRSGKSMKNWNFPGRVPGSFWAPDRDPKIDQKSTRGGTKRQGHVFSLIFKGSFFWLMFLTRFGTDFS